MRSSVYINNGTLYSRHTGACLREAAIVIDAESDVLLAYGEIKQVKPTFETLSKSGIVKGNGLCLVKAYMLPIEKQCYMLRRCIEYSASGFCRSVSEHLAAGDLEEWLDTEMARLPLKLYGED